MSKQHCRNATCGTILSTKSNVASTLLPFLATTSNEFSSFSTKSKRMELCRKDEILRWTRSTLLPFLVTKSIVASTKSNVSSTLLLVWTYLNGNVSQAAVNITGGGGEIQYRFLTGKNARRTNAAVAKLLFTSRIFGSRCTDESEFSVVESTVNGSGVKYITQNLICAKFGIISGPYGCNPRTLFYKFSGFMGDSMMLT